MAIIVHLFLLHWVTLLVLAVHRSIHRCSIDALCLNSLDFHVYTPLCSARSRWWLVSRFQHFPIFDGGFLTPVQRVQMTHLQGKVNEWALSLTNEPRNKYMRCRFINSFVYFTPTLMHLHPHTHTLYPDTPCHNHLHVYIPLGTVSFLLRIPPRGTLLCLRRVSKTISKPIRSKQPVIRSPTVYLILCCCCFLFDCSYLRLPLSAKRPWVYRKAPHKSKLLLLLLQEMNRTKWTRANGEHLNRSGRTSQRTDTKTCVFCRVFFVFVSLHVFERLAGQSVSSGVQRRLNGATTHWSKNHFQLTSTSH